ncbi:hypothetical protein EX30DRAFT_384819 [Ascodesmis nigricans]|uniref:Uncharacterized protein n=1 Tax=Ascodesmis nigricans TaxID=341454 RepID=A0A4S2MN10_9PEZI|nr:hypothetical protein EX30DRAFT_384819 [Ascodesmis nigricans]
MPNLPSRSHVTYSPTTTPTPSPPPTSCPTGAPLQSLYSHFTRCSLCFPPSALHIRHTLTRYQHGYGFTCSHHPNAETRIELRVWTCWACGRMNWGMLHTMCRGSGCGWRWGRECVVGWVQGGLEGYGGDLQRW